ncbi:MAG: TIGR02757 family protein [Tannerella sp.]|jgi:uncharacterized protein (TIGR02757 family)|nr:TIGR02757 family protein [Tannerella sp.]
MNLIKDYLDEQLVRIHTPAFIADDPVQFPRRYTGLQDIEIVSFIVSSITWGNRSMILRNAERMLSKLGDSPYHYVMNEDYRALGRANIHRTFFESDLAYMLRGFRQIYAAHETMEKFLEQTQAHKTDAPAWAFTQALQAVMAQANQHTTNTKCFPVHLDHSALKRINLALRWLVRKDGIVDLGVWEILQPCRLYIPLDVHVGNTARELGLLERKNNDRKAVEMLTARLCEFCPEDPVKYDFALFGIGINRKKN